MSPIPFVIGVPLAVFMIGGILCGASALEGANVPRALWAPIRRTFLPLTKHEFWFPPCPLCWATRGAIVGLAVLMFGRF